MKKKTITSYLTMLICLTCHGLKAQTPAPDYFRQGFSLAAFHKFEPDSIDHARWQFVPLFSAYSSPVLYVPTDDPVSGGYAANLNWRFGLCALPLDTFARGPASPYSYAAVAMSSREKYGPGMYEWDITAPGDSTFRLELGLIAENGNIISLNVSGPPGPKLQLSCGNAKRYVHKSTELTKQPGTEFAKNTIQTIAIVYAEDEIRIMLNKKEIEELAIDGWRERKAIPQEGMQLFYRPSAAPETFMGAHIKNREKPACTSALGMRCYADTSAFEPVIVKQAGTNPPVGRAGMPITIHTNWLRLKENSPFYPADIKAIVQKSKHYKRTAPNQIIIDESYSGTLKVPVVISDGVRQSNVFELTIEVAK
jgi:hypothetical protein